MSTSVAVRSVGIWDFSNTHQQQNDDLQEHTVTTGPTSSTTRTTKKENSSNNRNDTGNTRNNSKTRNNSNSHNISNTDSENKQLQCDNISNQAEQQTQKAHIATLIRTLNSIKFIRIDFTSCLTTPSNADLFFLYRILMREFAPSRNS